MHLAFKRRYASLRENPVDGALPNFVVLTGPNGAGKSNLIRGISTGSLMIDDIEFNEAQGDGNGRIRVFHNRFVHVTTDESTKMAQIAERWISIADAFENFNRQSARRAEESYISDFAARSGLAESALKRMVEIANKPLHQFTRDDFRRTTPFFIGSDAFSMQINTLFLTYMKLYGDNRYNQFLKEAGEKIDDEPLTDEEFVEVNGPPPWDLLNQVLLDVGLEYKFNHPTIKDNGYEPKLTDIPTGSRIGIWELSNGEQTILSIAASLYSGEYLADLIRMPEALLLDEPDASLHPSMAQSLLTVITETFVGKYGVKVILTTHSPTTVALAPEDSLYTMTRAGSPRIVKATRDEALASLLVGVPTLSVSNDNRRQVFVEAPDDVDCYQALFTILRPTMSTQLSLEFIASGRGGAGNRIAVEDVVTGLRERGNPILGVVDRDQGQAVPEGVFAVPERYAIENLILDPVAVGILLVRERIIDANEVLGTNPAFHKLSQEHAQKLADHVVEKARATLTPPQQATIDDGSTLTTTYEGGNTVSVATFALNHKGHDWEEKMLLVAFPGLNRFKDKLLQTVVDLVYKDLPEWIPREVRRLFEDLLAAA